MVMNSGSELQQDKRGGISMKKLLYILCAVLVAGPAVAASRADIQDNLIGCDIKHGTFDHFSAPDSFDRIIK